MLDLSPTILRVCSFKELVNASFKGELNAACWARSLAGDFAEIVNSLPLRDNVTLIEPQQLQELKLSTGGQLAREIILNDWKLLEEYGAQPNLNIITHYDRDEESSFFPTDVYSYHADRSPVASDTFLCTYYGAASELLPNNMVEQKVLIPEIRKELMTLYGGSEGEGFDEFLREHFFDLHYQPKAGAVPVNLGIGNLWRLAVESPDSEVLPCVHRAPVENAGQPRLLLIC
ncbi:MAG: hypothetical protein U0T75_14005 [Chitinophagales bacterium]